MSKITVSQALKIYLEKHEMNLQVISDELFSVTRVKKGLERNTEESYASVPQFEDNTLLSPILVKGYYPDWNPESEPTATGKLTPEGDPIFKTTMVAEIPSEAIDTDALFSAIEIDMLRNHMEEDLERLNFLLPQPDTFRGLEVRNGKALINTGSKVNYGALVLALQLGDAELISGDEQGNQFLSIRQLREGSNYYIELANQDLMDITFDSLRIGAEQVFKLNDEKKEELLNYLQSALIKATHATEKDFQLTVDEEEALGIRCDDKQLRERMKYWLNSGLILAQVEKFPGIIEMGKENELLLQGTWQHAFMAYSRSLDEREKNISELALACAKKSVPNAIVKLVKADPPQWQLAFSKKDTSEAFAAQLKKRNFHAEAKDVSGRKIVEISLLSGEDLLDLLIKLRQWQDELGLGESPSFSPRGGGEHLR